MPELKNPRHELVAVLVAKGDCAAGPAYAKAYPKASPATCETKGPRLVRMDQVAARVAELRAMWTKEAGATTTGVVKVLRAISEYDIADIMDWEWKIKGKGKRQTEEFVLRVKNLRDISPEARMAIKSIRMTKDGPELTFTDRAPAQRLVGLHLGMFQGETAGQVPRGSTYIDNRTTVFIDRPPPETLEQWKARVSKERGVKQIEGKVA